MIIDPATVPPRVSYRVLTGAVVPRPIALVSTISASGVLNLAPFSFFNAICAEPPIVCFSPQNRVPPKDTLANILATGEFVVNIVGENIALQMNACSGDFPPEADEFAVSGLTPVPSDKVRPPRVLESRVNMECRLMRTIELSALPMGGTLVVGEVVRFHLDDGIAHDFRIDADKLEAIGRMGGFEYSRTHDRFELRRPGG